MLDLVTVLTTELRVKVSEMLPGLSVELLAEMIVELEAKLLAELFTE